MKLQLVVAQGVHTGKVIPIAVPQFSIGRDPSCQLRPASPAISKRHCALTVKAEQVFVEDFGSTNGTFVNEQPVKGEVELKDQDKLRVGPLEFIVGIQAPSITMRATAGATMNAGAATVKSKATAAAVEEDSFAAMLLDGPADGQTMTIGAIPEGSTIMQLPDAISDTDSKAPAKKDLKAGSGDTSKAADEILKRYRQRPRG